MGILDTQCVYNLIGRLNYSKTKIDDALSDTSVNAVQNKVVTGAIEQLNQAIEDITIPEITTANTYIGDLEQGIYKITGNGSIDCLPSGGDATLNVQKGYLFISGSTFVCWGRLNYMGGMTMRLGAGLALGDKLTTPVGQPIRYALTFISFNFEDSTNKVEAIDTEEADNTTYATTLAIVNYVTTAIADKLSLSGGTMTGNLNMGAHNITNTQSVLINKNGNIAMGANCSIGFANNDGYIKGLKAPTQGSYAANKDYVDTVFSTLNYDTVTLLSTTLGSSVSTIKINQYNGVNFKCKEYCALLEIPRTSSVTQIINNISNTAGSTSTIVNIQPIYTTTQTNKKVLIYIKYKQNSNVYWTSESGSVEINSSATWDKIQTYPMCGTASAFDTNGIGSITFSGTFPMGTKITVWGDIQQ